MGVIPQSIKIGDFEISTGSLALVLLFLAGIVVFGVWVIDNADATTWKRLTAIGTGVGGFIAGWIGKSGTTRRGATSSGSSSPASPSEPAT